MPEKLKKGLGLVDVFCIASGAMISSGLFVLPAIASAKVGPALFVSYILASLVAVPTIFSKAELVTAMPRAGGDYFYISRSMGSVAGIIGGLSSWFSLSLKASFALIGMAAYVELIAHLPMKTMALALCLLFVALNLTGIKQAAKTQVILVLGLLAALLLYVFLGFPSIHIERYIPFIPFGFGSVFATAGFVFISYGGLTKVASVAEEIRNPARNIPVGMILSLVIVGLLYALVVFVTTGLLEQNQFQSSLTPISDAAGSFSGNFGAVIMAVAAILAFVSTANAGIISASRYPLAMARDKLLPGFFKRINSRFATPHYSILLTGTFMLVAILFLRLELLVKVASELLILLYIFTNIAVIIMRESKLQNYQPKFYSPLYPGMQILGIIGCAVLLAEMGRFILFLSSLFIACGLLWYLAYAGAREIKEFGLVHVIERVVDKELTSGQLSKELKAIIKERDEIVEDRFDRLIKESVVLDLEGTLSRDEFFQKASSFLAEKLGIEAKRLADLFIRREEESHTIIRPGLAIPHIIIEGEHKFSILLARAKEGVVFSETLAAVHTIFVLVGTRDERNFHLRALAAIAQIAQDDNFDKNWLAARNSEELRDILLLAERKRFGGK
jgi:APA family basic amino acid/polyamine antiporter